MQLAIRHVQIMLHTFQKQIRIVDSPERNKTGRVNTSCHRWQGPWSGSYLAVLCCCVEAMSGRVTGNACWVTELWSFWGAYGIGKRHRGRLKLFNFRNVPMGKGANWKISRNQGHEGNPQRMRSSESQSGEEEGATSELQCKITSQIR